MAIKISDYAGDDQTALVAVSMSYDPDSSQAVAHFIKPFLKDRDNVSIFTTIPLFLKKLSSFKKCVLIDEFSGTGKTIVQRVNVVSKDALARQHELGLKVVLMTAMEKAYSFMIENEVDVQVEQKLKAGLSAHFTGEDLDNAVRVMRGMEDRLARLFKDKPLPSLGYGEAEALYCAKNWNAPNSNFPILWWPETLEGKRRRLVFVRSGP